MKASPCKTCKTRHLKCHGRCFSYKSWKKEYTDSQNELKAERKKDQMLYKN